MQPDIPKKFQLLPLIQAFDDHEFHPWGFNDQHVFLLVCKRQGSQQFRRIQGIDFNAIEGA
jgi:hypothetical protein